MPDTLAPPDRDRRIVVAGSLAFDQIMDYPGDFKDHVLPDKVHTINLSFLVDELKMQRGGCAGNISYSLALLGQPSRVLAAAGHDFGEYRAWLEEQGVDTAAVAVHDDLPTACCFITTDRADNQITGFHPGAMARARDLSLAAAALDGDALVIVAPDDPEAMMRHCREAKQVGLPLAFDPSFQVIAMDGEALVEAARGAEAVVLNDYELAVFQEKSGRDYEGLLELAPMWIVTLGEEGSEIRLSAAGREKYGSDEATIRVPAAKVSKVVDPTGAGDSFRSGFFAGLLAGESLRVCGRMGSVASAFVIEKYGTQAHAYGREEFEARYRENFG